MRAHQLLLMLTWGSTVSPNSFKPFQRLVFDATKQLEGILDNETSLTSFIQTLASTHATKDQKLSVLYTIQCDHSWDCAETFAETKKLAIAINNTSNLDFILLWTVNVTEVYGSHWKPNTLNISWIQNYNAKLLLNIHKSEKCEHGLWIIENLREVVKPLVPGLGYDESLVECTSLPDAIVKYPFIVLHFSLGDTVGVAESFGLFRRRVNLLHFRHTEFLKKLAVRLSTEVPETIYYPYVQSIGDVCHQHLLESYGKQSFDGRGHEIGLVVQSTDPKPNVPNSTTGFRPIAEMYFKNTIRHFPGHLKAISQHFNSVFTNKNDWKVLAHNLLKSKSKMEVPFEIIVSGKWTGNETITAESDLKEWKATNESQNVYIGAIALFLVKNEDTNKSTFTSMIQFAKRMSSDFKTGCRVWTNDPAEVDKVLKTCDEFGSSLYYLNAILRVYEQTLASEIYSFEYENKMRKELQEVIQMGHLILQRKPKARLVVYSAIKFVPSYSPYWEVTNFCHDQTLQLNEHYEAVVNWAKCNNVEIIIRPPIDEENSPHSAWLSYLKPLYSWRSNYNYLHKLAKSNPYFVLRNYPENINGWNVDPCVRWETRRPEIKANYFHNQYVGAIFNPEQTRQNGTLTDKEYKIMLQFVMYGFYMAEIVLPSNAIDVFESLIWLESRSNGIDSKNAILLNYPISGTGNVDQPDGTEILNLVFEKLKDNKLNSIQGIHFDFLATSKRCIRDSTHPILSAKGLFANAQGINLKTGIVMDYTCCMDFIELLVFKNASSVPILNFLEKIDYLVCAEKHKIKTLQSMKFMGKVLDSQLYITKAFQELSLGRPESIQKHLRASLCKMYGRWVT